ncbi:hypothetical protein ACX0G9_04955 [Flavitalea flava]
MQKNIISLYYAVYVCVLLYSAAGCKKEENIKASAGKPEKKLLDQAESQNPLTGTYDRYKIIHLSRDTVYTLRNSFTREAGEQLVIEEGTLIKVSAAGADKGIIRIRPGGLIIANGSPSHPIVFTSLDPAGIQNANWDGISIQGKSYSNESNPYGDPTDQSGSLNYVRIEFAGLVLDGVGNGTIVENVQVSYSRQSSFEIDGGSFPARYLVSYACGGPADFYITKGYSGKMQHLLAYRHPFFGKAGNIPERALTGLFIENNPSDTSLKPYTLPLISNLTVLGPDGQPGSVPDYSNTSPNPRTAGLITTRNAHFGIRNSLFLGFPFAAWYVDDSVMAHNVLNHNSEMVFSIFMSRDSSHPFFLEPGAFPPNGNAEFYEYILRPVFNNQFDGGGADQLFGAPYNYESPDIMPKDTTQFFLKGANFDGPFFNNAFFNKVKYRGAFGTDNWLKGWTNFTPLHTNYNFPQ